MVTSSLTIDEIDEAKEREDLKILEAVFFVSGRFLNMQELISLSDLNPLIIKDLIEKLKEKYDSEDSALEIVEKNGLWKMDVKSDYESLVNKLATGSSEFTKAEQETLAIIAFKQPIKQSVIVKIRGNKAYDHIKKFANIGLIKKKKMGHTHELSLSDDFYDYFNISEEERSNVPDMNEKIKKQIENAEKQVEIEESALEIKNKLNEQLENKAKKVDEEVEKGSVEEFIEKVEKGEDETDKVDEKLENKAKKVDEEVEKGSVEEFIEKVEEQSEQSQKLNKEFEKVKKKIGASSEKFQEPAKGYLEEVETETTEEILEETAPEESSGNENLDAAEDVVEDVFEEEKEKEKIEKNTFEKLKKMS
jgi:segregation and condensation protein B